MKVIFHRTTDEGQDQLDGFVLLTGTGDVRFYDLPEWLAMTLDEGIMGRRPETIYPSAGIQFMEELPYEFNGSYLRAEIIDRQA